MTDPEHARPFDLVPSLALDAAAPLYTLLGAPPGDDSLRLHTFLKEAVDYAGFAPVAPPLWAKVTEYADATLTAQDRQLFLTWLSEAFTGYHPANVDLSGWLMALDHFAMSQTKWSAVGMTGPQTSEADAFVEHYQSALDAAAFSAALETCRSRPLSAWDKRMHQAYDFVYEDRQGGMDPFIILKFVHQGATLRRAIEGYGFSGNAGFPHDLLQEAAMMMITERHVWMPEGKVLGHLADVT